MKEPITLPFFFLIISFLFNGCAHYGGGTIGTGLPIASNAAKGGEISSSGTSYITFEGAVQYENGDAANSVEVTMKTRHLEETSTTDFHGTFSLVILSKFSSDIIDVEVNTGSRVYTGKFTIAQSHQHSQHSLSSGMGILTLLRDGSIRISGLNFFE
ncbi:MAG TPA: hypothetical protein PKA63_07385 [Oligoflexia bacterium]|nr:hypothetical protein [Oligoflexia bacterium]HMP48472.1 hypothetical protein [Oligoflexia bacterium]